MGDGPGMAREVKKDRQGDGRLELRDRMLQKGALDRAPKDAPHRYPTYPPPAYGVSWRARAGGCLPYRICAICGFAPKTWVPRFSVWVSENSAV